MKILTFRKIKVKLIFTSLYLFYVILAYYLHIPCIFKFTCKIICPGCGMTKAVIFALQLNLVEAFKCHPMFWSIPILFFIFLDDGTIFKNVQLKTQIQMIIIILFFCTYILRLLFIKGV